MQTRKPEGTPVDDREPVGGRPAGVWLDRAMLAMALAVALVIALLYLL